MRFLTRLVPALLAGLSFAHASAVVPRSDDFFSEFIGVLDQHNLTILADSYEKVADTAQGQDIISTLESKELTILAPKDCAFDDKNTLLDARLIKYSTLWGSIFNDFKMTDYHRRAESKSSHSVVQSTATRENARRRAKRQESSPYQVQVIDQFFTPGSRKRTNEDRLILVDRPVGNAKVVDILFFKKLVILIIDHVLTLPKKVSELLCLPLIKTEPNGLTKFGEALKKTGLSDWVDNTDEITIFAPIDDCLEDIDKLSKDDLTSFLKNHFFFGKIVFSPLFPKVCEATAQSGKELKFSFENDIHYVSCGKSKAIVLRRDVIPWNGVLHVIDRPLKCDH